MRAVHAVRIRLFLVAAFAVPVAIALGLPLGASAISVDAGASFGATSGVPVALQGSIPGRQILEYWIGDGNGPDENKLYHYRSDTGDVAVGPISDGNVFGWPGDLQRIDGVLYGLDSFRQTLYRIDDETTGAATQIGSHNSSSGYGLMSALAWDANDSLLFATNYSAADKELYTIDLQTGLFTAVTPLPYASVRGLAFDGNSGLLYMSDASTRNIYSYDPVNDIFAFVVRPNTLSPYLQSIPGDLRFYSELTFHDGQLYGTFRFLNPSGVEEAEVRRIDLVTGKTTVIGHRYTDVSIHSLWIDGVPEAAVWSVDSGPGTVNFENPDDPNTLVTFSADGTYVLRLTVFAEGGPIFDTVTVTVPEPGLAGLLGLGLLAHLVRRRGARGASAA